MLRRLGLNIFATDQLDRNELHIALAPPVIPNFEGIEYLVNAGVPLNARYHRGKTPSPNVIVPKATSDTRRPLLPNNLYFMAVSFPKLRTCFACLKHQNLIFRLLRQWSFRPLRSQAEKAAKPAAAKKAVLHAASEMKWVDIPDAKGAQQAVAWGNPQKGAHGSFAKFVAGTEVPLHTHTAGSRSVVISGTMMEGLEGQTPKELGPGSYFYVPGEVKHTTACKAGAECIIYTDWQGAFDLKPATP